VNKSFFQAGRRMSHGIFKIGRFTGKNVTGENRCYSGKKSSSLIYKLELPVYNISLSYRG
jgi:hypothetical protein